MSNYFNKRIVIITILVILLFPFFSLAQTKLQACSPNGYTVSIINGIFTDEKQAAHNQTILQGAMPNVYKNQKVTVNYFHNASHLAGLGDLVDTAWQKVMADDAFVDYDLTEILNDASQKVSTQKLLLVGHSQGNFYVNKFYDLVAGKQGGVPWQSIGVYGVATPANYIAGGGKYVTSNSDSVINRLRKGNYLEILPANIIIDLPMGDTSNGHSFSDNYLKYQGARMVGDIQSSLDKLKNNDTQDVDQPCIQPPEITRLHKIVGKVLAVADPTASVIKSTVVNTTTGLYNMGLAIEHTLDHGWSLLASVFSSTGGDNSASVAVAEDSNQNTQEDTPPVNPTFEPLVLNIPDTNTREETPIQNEIPETIVDTSAPVWEVADFMQNRNTGGGSPAPDPTPPAPPAPPAPTPDTTPPVITITGNNPEILIKNSTYTDAGATALDAVDGVVTLNTSGTVNTATSGTYTITYTATDAANNISTATRTVRVSTYVYIPKFSFGTENGDGNDWQAWWFNGSELYGWVSEYVNHYLHEHFKIQNIAGGHCSQCLQKGIFTRNPKLGFETSDVTVSPFENSPQGNNGGSLYDFDMQWDSTGYTFTIHDDTGGTVYATGHTNVSNVDQNMYVGWDGSFNNFTTFPSGTWMGVLFPSSSFPWSQNFTGGSSMILEPHAVFAP